MPKVSYVSFLDVWMVTCLVFVNGCMFEFILVTALVNRGLERLGDKVSKLYSSVLLVDIICWPLLLIRELFRKTINFNISHFGGLVNSL